VWHAFLLKTTATSPKRGGRSIENRIETIHQAPDGPHFEIHPKKEKSGFSI
jgi:hypothetical protein